VYETADDLAALQGLLDASMAAAGPHLRDLVDDEHRVGAGDLAALLTGINLLDVATVTATGEPRVAPVDGIFYRGRWYFGSSPDSARFRHLRRRPAVSACHTRGESLAVIVHGHATEISLDDPLHAAFAEALFAVYVPRYGDGWPEFARANPYAVITPKQMIARRARPEELEG
jgi:nitroimidazol reductase NimA-like FMN-containing flavoprotein (pyridoxamine 5'-phosphate oxidase superfamily)